jgi:hypothetical protein
MLRYEGQSFDGADYQPLRDNVRLGTQLERVYGVMADNLWHTLSDIALAADAPQPSVSAQLRHLRKERFGSHTIERRHVGNGLYEYRLI